MLDVYFYGNITILSLLLQPPVIITITGFENYVIACGCLFNIYSLAMFPWHVSQFALKLFVAMENSIK